MELDKEFNFDNFDPCSLKESYSTNGLEIEEWANSTFCNPPYGNLKSTKKHGIGWIEKSPP